MADATVLLVDDDRDFRDAIAASLRLAGHVVDAIGRAEDAMARLDSGWPGIILSDLRMPGLDGWGLFRRVRALDPELPVILMTAHGDIPEAVAALREGAYDFLAKPFDIDRMLESVDRAIAMRRLVLENRSLRSRMESSPRSPLLGHTPAIRAIRRRISELGPSDIDLVLIGETGTGKGLAAQQLHAASPRARYPFITIDCGALPTAQLDAELFGHVPGAFAGAARRIGRIEAAHRGTLFLDGIDDLHVEAQMRLLTVLDRREVRPLGSSQPRAVNLRIMASASADPAVLAESGRLRADFAYRLQGARLHLPPLRDRQSDILLLFAHFAAASAQAIGREPPAIAAELGDWLLAHDWPGNLHELCRHAEQHAQGGTGMPVGAGGMVGLSQRMARLEASLIGAALAEAKGDIASTCALLDLPRKTLYDKLKRHGLSPSAFRSTRP